MTASTPGSDGLSDYIADWQPENVRRDDDMAPDRAQQLADTLDITDTFNSGAALPPLWQWLYFLDWPTTAELGPDGHPSGGHFLPPIPHRRRMFAGGRMTQRAPLVLGKRATRTSSMCTTDVKRGRTGEMLIVTVRQEYSQGGEIRVVEEQDLVYRSESTPSASFTKALEPLTASTAEWSLSPSPDPVLLFRFSALTANAHRIHYDESYTRQTEGYPALVVHGPLLAIYMCELVRSRAGARPLQSFQFRLRKPVFLGDPFGVQGSPSSDTVELVVVSGSGSVHACATATFA
jgi:3-methylfumaryl-CoA hydratase